MGNINDIKESLELLQSRVESAGWNADQAADNAKDAVSESDSALSVIGELIDEVDSIIGYNKHNVDTAMRHLKVIAKLHAMYLNRLENLIDNNDVDSREDAQRYGNLISVIDLVTYSVNDLQWDQGYKFESVYENGSYGYKTVKAEEVNNG